MNKPLIVEKMPLQIEDEAVAQAAVREICKALGEKRKKPRTQIKEIVSRHGIEAAQQLMREALDIEARGGKLIKEGSRRRTPGGVFFQLVRERRPHEPQKEAAPKISSPHPASAVVEAARRALSPTPLPKATSAKASVAAPAEEKPSRRVIRVTKPVRRSSA